MLKSPHRRIDLFIQNSVPKSDITACASYIVTGMLADSIGKEPVVDFLDFL
jgi:hypothetical protein